MQVTDWHSWYNDAVTRLVPIFGERESSSLLRIIREDLLSKWKESEGSAEGLLACSRALERLIAGEPIQYIVGSAHFYGRDFQVDPSVLIPRPETEELVALTCDKMKDLRAPIKVLDVGTGSGCIAITLALEVAGSQVCAIDVSEKALVVASTNADRMGAAVDFLRVDFLDESGWGALGQFDLIVSNPPYIAESERPVMSTSTLAHEPHQALFAPISDPDLFYRLLVKFGRGHLESDGMLLAEINEHRAREIKVIADASGWSSEIMRDLSGKDRFLSCRLPKNH